LADESFNLRARQENIDWKEWQKNTAREIRYGMQHLREHGIPGVFRWTDKSRRMSFNRRLQCEQEERGAQD
jgi:hypothetical protein